MMEASEKMEYEEAAKYRDLIASVKQVAQKQRQSEFNDFLSDWALGHAVG